MTDTVTDDRPAISAGIITQDGAVLPRTAQGQGRSAVLAVPGRRSGARRDT